jgi:endonuclease YncB( thermonuclease family)
MQKNRKRRGLFLSVLTLCILAGYLALGVGTSPTPYPVEDFSKDTAYPVLKVVDGDTVKIDYEGKENTVRLIGVDTPETVHPTLLEQRREQMQREKQEWQQTTQRLAREVLK